MSIVSFPDRGPWGKASWRGNCTGHLFRFLFERLRPKFFVDAMAGSFTSIEVAREMGIEAVGLDLHLGFDILRDSILHAVGKPADLTFTHPPYGAQIRYSGNVWGDAPHPDDLSHCASDEEFHHKLNVALLNQRAATREGGYYSTLLGDWRRNGLYTCYMAIAIAMMPQEELAGVIVKEQHNTTSSRQQYKPMSLPFITHEFLVLWRRKSCPTYHLLGTLASMHAQRLRGTWRAVVRLVMITLGGRATLQVLYAAVAEGCPDRVKNSPNWQAKIRQVVNSSGEYTHIQRGEWALAQPVAEAA